MVFQRGGTTWQSEKRKHRLDTRETEDMGLSVSALKNCEKYFPKRNGTSRSKKKEALGFDLDNTGPFRFQCKRNKKYCSISKIEEVQDLKGTIPALITQGDRKRPVVALYLDDLIRILEDIGVAYEGVSEPITGDMF